MKTEVIVLLVFATLLQLPRLVRGCQLQNSEDRKTTRAFNCLENDENSLILEENYPETTILNFRPNASSIKTFPSTIFEKFSKLESIVMSSVGLENIERGSFHAAGSLKMLNLEKNRLQKIIDESFQGARALKLLKLNKNNISSIEEKAFSGLESLTELDLSRNDIEFLPENVFRDISTLEKVDLSFNKLQTVPKNVFSSSPNLKSIKIFKNYLHTFDVNLASDRTFCYLNVDNNSINYFSLTFTRLIEATSDDIDCTLYGIHASHNEIQHFYVSRESTAVNLIAINGNRLKNLQNVTLLPALTKLDIGNNPELAEDALNDGLKLSRGIQSLSLKELNLTRLDPEVFLKLSKLTELDLSKNQLTNLDLNVFPDGLTDFYKLNLANNHLTSLDVEKLQEKFPNLTFLNIKGNQFTRNQLKSILEALKNVTVIQ
ncbi:leucine-rich repeat-containing protein 15-like [Culicoides brevitarsis]|uniref:leucine-rich repeat-containing protein 15-like n=1 Tax=Culicoides brevitarsis TaxID=469753 RepID=UPI00307C19DC